MSNFLRDLALAHQKHEGYYPGSYSYRQNNPGNLRGRDGIFITFKTYEAGLAALEYDLKAKITGVAGSIQRYMFGTGKSYEQLVFQEYVAIFAPSADRNNPVAYCNALCADLRNYYVTPETPLCVLAQLVRGEIDRVPDPPVPMMSLEQRLVAAEKALKWASPQRATMLGRLIERLRRLLMDPL